MHQRIQLNMVERAGYILAYKSDSLNYASSRYFSHDRHEDEGVSRRNLIHNPVVVAAHEYRPIFVRIRGGPSRDGTVRGGAYWGPTQKGTPYLCSREAIPYEETSQDFDEFLKQLGFDTLMVRDKFGQKRSFVVFDTVYAVEAQQFKADYTKLHDPCTVSFLSISIKLEQKILVIFSSQNMKFWRICAPLPYLPTS
ncbi:unnamed protein product [Strongylus vulgaris]|uniref:Uncharacterized protein n=1 Tax=Strongylus vulgaris TaxID=40348 RepID=A0A3P7J5G5_STRVU|nr:unnamed protein product [Strongylus vulgaris]